MLNTVMVTFFVVAIFNVQSLRQSPLGLLQLATCPLGLGMSLECILSYLVSVPDPKPTSVRITFSILEVIYTPGEVSERDCKLLCTCESALAVSRQPVAYVAWEPTKAEIELLRENPKRRKVEPGSTIGEDIKVTIVPEHVHHFSLGNNFFLASLPGGKQSGDMFGAAVCKCAVQSRKCCIFHQSASFLASFELYHPIFLHGCEMKWSSPGNEANCHC